MNLKIGDPVQCDNDFGYIVELGIEKGRKIKVEWMVGLGDIKTSWEFVGDVEWFREQFLDTLGKS